MKFYILPDDQGFYDPEGYFFDSEGFDADGGHYDKFGVYHAPPKSESRSKQNGKKTKKNVYEEDDDLIRQFEGGNYDDNDDAALEDEFQNKYFQEFKKKEKEIHEEIHGVESEDEEEVYGEEVQELPKNQYAKKGNGHQSQNYPTPQA